MSNEKPANGTKMLIDGLANLVAGCMDWIGAEYGDEAAEKCLRYIGQYFAVPAFEAAQGDGIKVLEIVREMQRVIGDVKVVEDDEKVQTLWMCGTAGRMKREKSPLVARRNKEGLPYYCGHCPLWWETMAQEAGYNMRFYYSEDGPCVFEYRKK